MKMFTKKTRVISAIATVCMLISMFACIAVPAHAAEVNYPSVQTVTAAGGTGTDYTVANVDDWMYLDAHLAWFNRVTVTIHLTGDIDLSDAKASGFDGFNSAYISLNGHGHTIENWNFKSLYGYYGIFSSTGSTGGTGAGKGYGGKYIGNIVFKNVQVDSGYVGAVVVGGFTGTGNASDDIVFENLEFYNCKAVRSTDAYINQMGVIVSKDFAASNSMTFRNIKMYETGFMGTRNLSIQNCGFLIGSTNNSKAYTFEDVYLYDCFSDVRTAAAGGVIGSAEASAPYTFNNVGVFNSEFKTENATTTAAVMVGIATAAPTSITFNNCIASGTTSNSERIAWIKQATGTNRALQDFATNCYSDFGNLYATGGTASGAAEDQAKATAIPGVKTITQGDIASLKPAGNINAALDTPNFYWNVDSNGKMVPCDVDESVHKVDLVPSASEPVIESFYGHAGENVEISFSEDPAATFTKVGGNGTLTGSTVTLPKDGSVTKIQVHSATVDLENVSYPSVTTVNSAADRTGTDYSIANVEEWMYFFEKYKYFQSTDVTIHLTGDIDLSGKTVSNFEDASFAGTNARYASFINPAFSIDGHGKSIKNWGSKGTPMKTMGMFRFTIGAGMKFIKNLTLDNCHTTGSGGFDSTLLVTLSGADNAGRFNMASDFVMENVHIKNSSLTAEGARSGFFIANYVKADGDYSVTLKNCSLIDSTLTGNDSGHSGLLIGKASSYNGNKTTYNLSDIYVSGNTLINTRTTTGIYVGLGIGNFEVNTPPVETKLNINNVVFEGNILNTAAADIALFGNLVATKIAVNGLVFEDTTVTTTATETGRHLFKSGAASDGKFTLNNVYCDDAKITSIASDVSPVTGVKMGESYMTSGEAAWAVNTTASADSKYWYTYNAETGVEVGDSTNATRKVMLELSGEVVKSYYRNVGTSVEVDYEGATGYEIKSGSAGTINGKVVTVDRNADVTVLIVGDEANKTAAKADLQESIKYFTDRNIKYYVAGAATELAAAQAVLADPESTTQNYIDAKAALDEYKNQYVGKSNAPSVSEMDRYPGAPAYVLREAADFVALNSKKSQFDADDTVYMAKDIDMKGSTFKGIEGFQASFDGQGYEIQNWGIAADGSKANLNSRGLFYTTSAVATYIKSLKNVTFKNCHINTWDTCSAMLYGIYLGNDGLPGTSTTNLMIEDIHFDGCSMTITGYPQGIAFLISRYSVLGKSSSVTVNNCSVTNSIFDATGVTKADGCHYGLLIGKPRNNKDGACETAYYFNDCYVANNTVKTVRPDSQYQGMVFGTVEYQETTGKGTKLFVNNLGVIGNTFNVGPATQANLLCDAQGSAVAVNGLIVKGNTVTGTNNPPVVLFNNGTGVTLKNAYCADTLNKVTSAGSAALTGTAAGAEAAWAANSVSAGDLYWTTTDGVAAKGTADNATRKVELKLENGDSAGIYYVNVGAGQALDYSAADNEEFLYEGSDATLVGNTLTLNKNTDVVVTVKLNENDAFNLAKAQLQDAINYFKLDRNIDFFNATVKAEVTAAEALLETSNDIDALNAEINKLEAQRGAYVGAEAYPNLPAVTDIAKYPGMKNFTISDKAELEYLSANHTADKFNVAGMTIHLADNIDMSKGGTTSTFKTLQNSKIALNGHGKKIHNWIHDWNTGSWNDRANAAFFSGEYMGGSIKDLTFEDCSFKGGYSRAVLFCEYTGTDVVIDNVDMIRVTLDTNCTNDHNQMGLYVSRSDAKHAALITIQNCLVKECKLKNNCGTNINNCGILAGSIRKGYSLTVKNVDLFDCENNTETGAGGLAIGSFENTGKLTVENLGVFGGKITTHNDSSHAGVVLGLAADTCTIEFKNCVAMDVTANSGDEDTTQPVLAWHRIEKDSNPVVTGTGCVADFDPVAVKCDNSTGEYTADVPAIAGCVVTQDTNEAAYLVGRFISDADYPSFEKRSGYAKNYKVEFKNVADGGKIVGTFYTDAFGKIDASDLLNNVDYSWKLEGVAVNADTVYTADSIVESNVIHEYTGTIEHITGTNTHKAYCKDAGCQSFIIVDCQTDTYAHVAETNTHKEVCVCNNVIRTVDCDLTITAAEGDVHNEDCAFCEYDVDVECVYTDWDHTDGVEAAAQHTGTCACGDTKKVGCDFNENKLNDAGFGVCGETKYTCKDCEYSYSVYTAMKTDAELVISAENVKFGEEIKVIIKLKPGTCGGISNIDIDFTYDATKLTIKSVTTKPGFTTVNHDDSVEGTIKFVADKAENVTNEVEIVEIVFDAIDIEAKLDFGATVNSAKTIVDTEARPAEVKNAAGEVNVRPDFILGDINDDGKVSLTDAILALRLIAKRVDENLVKARAADMNGDNDTTTADVVLILREVLKQI